MQGIVYHLETATTTHLWDDELNLNTTHPLLMKDLDPSNATHCLTPDPRLGVPTRRNVSGIHLPLEVYEGCELKFCLHSFVQWQYILCLLIGNAVVLGTLKGCE